MDTILIVEDELSVRTTLKEWLAQSRLDLKILVASDAAGALQEASQHAIDLAILDWNLGAGLNGLQLLEDLHEFQRELVAILITGYANQATPLDALRLGVRDYLDKNHDFTRDRFLASVRRQLERILPQKRERLIHQQLVRFRAVVQEALPKLETACALQQEGITLENTLKVLLTHARQLTRAQAAFLYLHRPLPPPGQKAGLEVYNQDGQRLSTHPAGEYSHTLAAAIASMAPEVINTSLAQISQFAAVQLSPHETAHQQLLGMTLLQTPAITIVLQLFDKLTPGSDAVSPFTPEDIAQLEAWQPLAAYLLRLVCGERESQKILYDTLRHALTESEQFVGQLAATGYRQAAREAVTLAVSGAGSVPPALVHSWAEALHRLTERYGPQAVERVLKVLAQMEGLLDEVTQAPAN